MHVLSAPQIPPAQSPSTAQPFPGPHGEHGPPQSVSVSCPFWSASLHDDAKHEPPTQTLLAQSDPFPQPFPSPHFSQAGPPQSTSVSEPSFVLSIQLGVEHIPPEHIPPAQSPSTSHDFPSAHRAQADPPQSTSVSAPFRTPSVHVGSVPPPDPPHPGSCGQFLKSPSPRTTLQLITPAPRAAVTKAAAGRAKRRLDMALKKPR